MEEFGLPLFPEHQDWLDYIEQYSTYETIRLYFALKERGVPALLEKFDGYKHIDSAIPEARVQIEVDGSHHNRSAKQAFADLKRTYYSFLKGYVTLRIPNALTYKDDVLEATADYLVGILEVNRDRSRR